MPLKSLRHSLTLNFLLAALVPIILLSVVVLYHLANDATQKTEEHNLMLAETVSNQVDVFLNEPKSILLNISHMLSENPSWENDIVHQVLDLHIKDSKIFESIYLLNEEGTVINIGLPPEIEEFHDDYIGISLGHLPFYIQTVVTGNPTWSDTFLSVLSGNISIALCVPTGSRNLVGYLDIHYLSNFVLNLNQDKKTLVALIDKNGTIIVHPDPLLGKTQLNVNNLSIVKKGLAGLEQTDHFTFNNVNYIGSVKKVTNPEWVVLVSQTVEDTYHQVFVTAISFLIVSFLACLVAILFAILKSRNITQPVTEIASHAQQIASGYYNVEIANSPYAEINELTQSIRGMADAVQTRENQLQMSQKRFREIYNTTSEAIFIRNAHTLELIDANKTMTDLFGYTIDELKEKSILDLSSGDPDFIKKRINEKINKALHEGPQFFEWNYIRKNGDPFWSEVTLKEAEIDGKKRLLGVIRDISERKTLERQLAQSQKMEAIGTLAGGIAHDFNNILTPILGYVEMAMIHRNDPDKLEEDLNEVLRAVQRAKELVQQILAFSRQEGQQAAPTDVTIIIKEALKLLRSSIPSTITIKQNIQSGCGLVLANPTQIHQILMNLCTNAYHAMREKGGVLSVSLTSFTIDIPHNPVHKNLPTGNYLRLEVSDTGHGMDKEILHRILEPYFTTKSVDEGTGLGLSVVHGIIKSLGGEINVYSEIGKGSTFDVYLPVIEGSMHKELKVDHGPLVGGNETILLVDDEQTILNLQEEMLTNLGYMVEVFNDPEEALQFFTEQSQKVDLVISDMTMPKITGDILVNKLREVRPGIPVIICTGFSESMNKEKAFAMGIDEFLTKPLELYSLAGTVRSLLDRDKTAENSNVS